MHAERYETLHGQEVPMIDVQAQLNKLYETILVEHPKLGTSEIISGPFLVSAAEEYLQSSPRIAIVGQETFGYIPFQNFCASTDRIEYSLSEYRNFDFGVGLNGKKYNSAFWSVFRQIQKELCKDVHRSIIWTNLILFDVNQKSIFFVGPELVKAILGLQRDIFQRQMEILKPDVVLFLTGVNTKYDELIRRFYPGIVHKNLNVSGLSKVYIHVLEHSLLPKKTLRTYHPGYLNRQGKKIEEMVINQILSFIRE